jgi:predicted kinase
VARDYGRLVVAIRFDVPAAQLLERNEQRERVLRENVVVTMAMEMDEHAQPDDLAREVDLVLDAEDVRRRLNAR